MKAFLLSSLLVAVMLSGCAQPTAQFVGPDDGVHAEDADGAPPRNGSHPAYNYPTEEDLPEDNRTDEDHSQPAGPEPPQEPATPDEPADPVEEEPAPAPQSRWKKPAMRPLPDAITGLVDISSVQGASDGAGIGIFGPLAFVGATGGPLTIVDILDPTDPKVITTIDVPARDVGTILYPDDRLIVVTTGGGKDLYFTDVTDPGNPFLASTLTTPHSNHNLVVVPGTPIVYNSTSTGRFTDIIDAGDPYAPFLVKEWENGDGCHDAEFHYDHQKGLYRGYCAGLDVVQIWDILDPLDPTIITEFGFPAAGIHDAGGVSPVMFAHLATINHDASVLIVGDETGGGAAPGCDAYAQVAGTTVTGPLGNLWFYDISDETDPVLHGSISPGAWEDTGTCTAHFGGVIEDRDQLAMAFYNHGVLLIDFSDLDNPYILDRHGRGKVWDVQYYQGYLFTGDMSRGMDVLSLS